jgi:hypothetical protein
MKILSIDVGIKNLAFCLFEKPSDSEYFKINKWDSINVSESISSKCEAVDKTGICNKPAKYSKDDKCFCLKHSKKLNYQIPTSELKTNFINKQKIQQLLDLADKYKIPYKKPIKKLELIEIINEYIQTTCFQQITSTNASKVDIVTIGENIKSKFEKIFDEEGFIDHIIIENQISPIANRMKTIQGLITQYFIMKGNYENIEFISASNKLKDCSTSETATYSSRKKMGITKCLEYLNNDHRYNSMLEYFKKHVKKDDLADSFLQGIWFINNKLV